jgi:DHA2 family multidrug resistance protein
MAAYGLGIIIAPILGPTLGGWITDNYTWRWIFYINLPVGIISLLMISHFVIDPHYLRKRVTGGIDLWGIGFLALGFGMLQMVLDTGQRKDWFGSNQIRLWAAMCVIGLVGMVVRELTAKHPIVDLRVLKDRTFAAGTFLMTMLGFVLYGSLMLLPIYLQTLLNYPAFQAGLALSPRGIGALILTPITGQLTNRIDPRKLLAVGIIVGGSTMFSFSHLNLNAGYWDIFWPQLTQGAAMAFMFIPLMASSMSGIAKEKMGNATSIYNLMRNIGGSIGIATATTLLVRRSHVHQNYLVAHLTAGAHPAVGALAALANHFALSGFDPTTAHRMAVGAIYRMAEQQASLLAYADSFRLLGWLALLAMPLVLLFQRVQKR